MTKQSYETFEEWYKDFETFQKNPEDKTLLHAIERRSNNSSKKIKKEIKDFLENATLATNPYVVFDQVMNELGQGYLLIVKDSEDPWFKC